MKKILFMVGMMNIGGVEKSLLSLLSVLPKEELDVTILMLEKKGGFLDQIPEWVKIEEATWYKEIKPIILQPPRLTIKELYVKKKFFRILPFILNYLTSKYLKNRYLYYKYILKSIPKHKGRFDIAVSYQGPNDIIDYYIANKVSAKKKISWVHFDVSKFGMNKKLYKKLYKKFDKLFIVSNEAKSRLIERIPSIERKAEVFLNVVSSQLVSKMGSVKINLDQEYDGVKIVTVGRLSKEKGQDIAIKALAKLRKEGYKVRWYCIGEGNFREDLEKLIEDLDVKEDFHLLGSKTNPYPFISEADIYVQTSRHEGYCLTLAEAKCLNKPIITTNFIGAYEQIENGINGWIVEANEDEVYKRVKHLIDYPYQRELLSKSLKTSLIDTTHEADKLIYFV
ncbi:glycosyltransferase [Mesobacillus jeotgali]|uniref:glycosyltransferase n=1 Tax=Mesobacillus jeotgali TaxID=129985 RepID=UPI0009A7FA31|nr:glycosyltransferase [Mesobacillus jeotgali]